MIAWTTQDECKFIDRLGEHSKINFSRIALLHNYRLALDRRDDLTGLDVNALKVRCEKNIARAPVLPLT